MECVNSSPHVTHIFTLDLYVTTFVLFQLILNHFDYAKELQEWVWLYEKEDLQELYLLSLTVSVKTIGFWISVKKHDYTHFLQGSSNCLIQWCYILLLGMKQYVKCTVKIMFSIM